MHKIIVLFIASICLLFFSNTVWSQAPTNKGHKVSYMTNRLPFLVLVDERPTIVQDRFSLLLCGSGSVIASGSNFFGFVKAYEMMATGNTIVGIAVTDRMHSYRGNSKALIAIGGSAEKSDGVHGIGDIGGDSLVVLAIGDVAFVKNNAHMGIVLGDVSFVSDSAFIGIVVGKVSHQAKRDSVLLHFSENSIKVNIPDHLKKIMPIKAKKGVPAVWKGGDGHMNDMDWPVRVEDGGTIHRGTFSF